MPIEITMPQLSDTMTEGTLIKWLKKEGDKVKANEIIAEVETDKATMEMESFEGGTLAHIAVKEGGKVGVGAVVAVLASSKENPADVKKQYAGGGKAESAPAKPAAAAAASTAARPAAAEKSAGGKQDKQGSSTATIEQASSDEIHDLTNNLHGATRQQMEPISEEADGNGHDRLRASPLARRIAAAEGISLADVSGTGPSGRILQRDVLGFKGKSNGGGSGAAPAPEKQVIPMTKMRAAIAAALQKSKQTIPHFYETIDIDVEEVTKLRERLNQRLEKEKVRLSIADFVTAAVVFSLGRHPALNARLNSEKNEITRYSDVNLGIAVAVPDGLIVPVLRGVNHMGLKEIRQRSADLIERARGQKLRREEQTEGTFTISSLGTLGVREFSAIINPPEVAILAVGSAEKRAVVRGEQIVARMTMSVTLSADHRAVDGAVAAEFLQTLKASLEEPGMMLV